MDKKKILIVDDEKEMVEMEAMRLEASGYQVLTAFDGESGIQMAQKEKPDIILLDIMLPKLDGYLVCAKLKRDSHCVDIPIILLTAVDHNYDPDLGRKVGADFYIMKPFEPKTLLAKIKELIKKYPRKS